MGKYFRTTIEFASLKDCKDIATIDAKVMTSDTLKIMYVESNLLTYYVAINTWLAIIEEWSQFGWISVLETIKDRGLLAIIAEFDKAAYQLIKGEELTSSLVRGIYHDVYSTRYVVGVAIDPTKNAQIDPFTAILQICRYLKRFSPSNASALQQKTLADYEERARILAREQRQIHHSRFILTAIRDSISEFINWDGMCDELEDTDISDMIFTSGTSFDTDRTLMSKLRRVAEKRIEYFPIPFGMPMVANHGYGTEEKWGYCKDIPVHVTRVVPVPKNYKTARIIAPEDVVRQGIARRYFVIMDKWLKPDCGIMLHDQGGNQRLAADGSRTGLLATLDLSNASDSITATLLAELFPTRFVHLMRRVLPTHVMIGKSKKRYLIQTAAPMGNGVTFWILSTICRNVALAAVKYFNLFTGSTDERVAAYGDDVIVPTDAAQTVIEWFEALGFKVNRDKSYYSHDLKYRESCGEEFLNGCCTTTIYYPRFPILGKFKKAKGQRGNLQVLSNLQWDGYKEVYIDTLSSLVELQHKLFFLSRKAATIVAELVREAEPRMTCSFPPSNLTGCDGDISHSDLYDYHEDFKCKCARGRTKCANCFGSPSDLRSDVCSSDDPWVRKQHLVPITAEVPAPCDSVHTEQEEYALVKLYNYQQFLKYGPRYATALDRLLGISEPPMRIDQARGSIKIKWVYMG
jgi:hypothetical protein